MEVAKRAVNGTTLTLRMEPSVDGVGFAWFLDLKRPGGYLTTIAESPVHPSPMACLKNGMEQFESVRRHLSAEQQN
jgi:hypothetical protein